MKRASFSLLIVMLLAGPIVSQAESCSDLLSPQMPAIESPSGISGYFLMTRRFENGKFTDLIGVLPDLHAMGINTVWISPPNPQTEAGPPRFTENDHGYWVADHRAVDEAAGGEAGFHQLIDAARAEGIGIMIDAPIGQFGYGDDFRIGDQDVSVFDERYFVDQTAHPDRPRPALSEDDLWARIEHDQDPAELRRLMNEVADYPYLGLPKLRTDNPEVARYITESYERFIDRGVDMFRIDSGKRISIDFLADWINNLNTYAAVRGRHLKFMIEFLMSPQRNFNFFFSEIQNRVHDKNSLYFIDFPMQWEFRHLLDPQYKFSWLKGFMEYRENEEMAASHFIPMVEDHDTAPRIADPFAARLIYAVTEYFSANPTFLFHGSEQSGVLHGQRVHLDHLNADGDIGKLRHSLGLALNPFRLRFQDVQTEFLVANDDVLIVEKRLPGEPPLFLMVNKGNATATSFVNGIGFEANAVVRVGEPSVENEPSGTRIALPPHSLLVIRGDGA